METNREADLYTPKEALKPKGDMYAQITQIGGFDSGKAGGIQERFPQTPGNGVAGNENLRHYCGGADPARL